MKTDLIVAIRRPDGEVIFAQRVPANGEAFGAQFIEAPDDDEIDDLIEAVECVVGELKGLKILRDAPELQESPGDGLGG